MKQIILSHGHGTRYPNDTPVYPGKSSPDKRLLEGQFCSNVIEYLVCHHTFDCSPYVMPTGIWNIPLKQRARWADRYASLCDPNALLIEVHTNAARKWGWKDKARGTTVFYNPAKKRTKKYAEIISDNFYSHTSLPSRGIKKSRMLGMLRLPKIDSIIVEMGFHTSRIDVEYMLNNRLLLVDALYNSIIDIQKL